MITQVLHCPNVRVQILLNMASLRRSSGINVVKRPAMSDVYLRLSYPGQSRQVKQQVDMALNGSGVRDTARVLHVSPSTVIRELKKEHKLQQVNLAALKHLNPEQVEVDICLVQLPEEVENRNQS